jgi:hypothetical protein
LGDKKRSTHLAMRHQPLLAATGRYWPPPKAKARARAKVKVKVCKLDLAHHPPTPPEKAPH